MRGLGAFSVRAVASSPRERRAGRPGGGDRGPSPRPGRFSPRGHGPSGERRGPSGASTARKLVSPSFNPPPGRLSFQDRRGCKPFEVHQHGEVLLYFLSPRFIPGRGRGRPRRLLRSLGLPRRTRGRWDPCLRGEAEREPGRAGWDRSLHASSPFRRSLPPSAAAAAQVSPPLGPRGRRRVRSVRRGTCEGAGSGGA